MNTTPPTDAQGDETTGWRLIRAERARQIEVEGYTPEHDAGHAASALLRAARCYETARDDLGVPETWPREIEAWKPKGPLRNLARAGALYLAAADRAAVAGPAAARCAEAIDLLLAEVDAARPVPAATHTDEDETPVDWDDQETWPQDAIRALNRLTEQAHENGRRTGVEDYRQSLKDAAADQAEQALVCSACSVNLDMAAPEWCSTPAEHQYPAATHTDPAAQAGPQTLREVSERATPGVWRQEFYRDGELLPDGTGGMDDYETPGSGVYVIDESSDEGYCLTEFNAGSARDAALIVAAVNDLRDRLAAQAPAPAAPTPEAAQARLREYENGADADLTDADRRAILAGRCGPLRYGGPCWLLRGHDGLHYCHDGPINALLAAAPTGTDVAPGQRTVQVVVYNDEPGPDVTEVERAGAESLGLWRHPDGWVNQRGANFALPWAAWTQNGEWFVPVGTRARLRGDA